jgi:hypothetical protein
MTISTISNVNLRVILQIMIFTYLISETYMLCLFSYGGVPCILWRNIKKSAQNQNNSY